MFRREMQEEVPEVPALPPRRHGLGAHEVPANVDTVTKEGVKIEEC